MTGYTNTRIATRCRRKDEILLKHKKIIWTVLLLATIACGLCACKASDIQENETAGENLPTLAIGVDDLRPFFYTDENGDYAGIDADIAAEACKRAGYQPEFVKIAWTDRQSSLKDGTVDCIWNAFVKNGREEDFLWTEPYMQSDLRIIEDGQKPDKDIESLGENTGIAVRAGSKMQELLLESNGSLAQLKIYACGNFEMAETAFVKGYVVALGGHEAVLQDVINKYPGQYHFLDGSLLTTDLAVAFSKGEESEAYSKINDAIASMKADGTIQKILEKYNDNTTITEEVPANGEN